MPNIYVTVTIDWEGAQLEDNNIAAMQAFRRTFPTLPITHFICPAYFSRTSKLTTILLLSRKINSVLKLIDEVGLHLHCWYSLMDMAIGKHYTTPTWNANNEPGTGVPYDPPRTDLDYGHDVPLGAYTQVEIQQALVTGIQLLRDTPLIRTGSIYSFRCGGWMAGDKVLRALRVANVGSDSFDCEASAVPGRYFRMVIAPVDNIPLDYWIPLIWSEDHNVALPTYLANSFRQSVYPGGITGLYPNDVTTPISQPDLMNMLIQMPDTAALADYVSPETLATHIQAAINISATQNIFISLGWHDSNAAEENFYVNKTNIQVIADAINLIPSATGIFMTVRDAAQRWLELQIQDAQGLEPSTLKGNVDTQAVMPYIQPVAGPRTRST